MAAYFRSTVREFLERDSDQIIGELTRRAGASHATLLAATVVSWERTISVLKRSLSTIVGEKAIAGEWGLLLEYEIPRRDRRIDVVLLTGEAVIVLEFKTGDSGDLAAARRQAEHYSLDLRDFHRESRGRAIVPVVVMSAGPPFASGDDLMEADPVKAVLSANDETLHLALEHVTQLYRSDDRAGMIDVCTWDQSPYGPVPSIVEAAQMLYSKQSVREISHAHADAHNLTKTSDLLVRAVVEAQTEGHKIICFVTGVPGAGKTLAGLNAVHSPELMRDGRPAGAFLSGNGPLVKVISEALARDHHARTGESMDHSRRRIRTFIQSVHSFLKEYRPAGKLPPERVIVFDEAQRAWDSTKVRKELLQRATASERDALADVPSEPMLMLSIMDRLPDWGVLIALVGGGQEIHDGEAGLAEWGRALRERFAHWQVWASTEALEGGASVAGNRLFVDRGPGEIVARKDDVLHLAVCVRSYRAESVAAWVNAVVGADAGAANSISSKVTEFPIVLTRNLASAREWLRKSARGFRRCGLLASSGALRLRAHGLEVSSGFRGGFSFEDWFLAPPEDIRSSSVLEVALTEFECQGLELDWCGLCWGDDFTWSDAGWDFRRLTGSKWQQVQKSVSQEFLRNKYRVLLTRAREGMVIWVPRGDSGDPTRDPVRLDSTAEYLRRCGVGFLD